MKPKINYLAMFLISIPKKTGSVLWLTASFLILWSGQFFAQGTWMQKADFPTMSKRMSAVGFSIGTKGYIGTGQTSAPMVNSVLHKDLWEWDQVTNIWTQKANFGGGARTNAVGFSVGNKGYIGTGADMIGSRDDFWEWDQATNTWTQKANFPLNGGSREAVGFSIGNKGYIGTGLSGSWSSGTRHQDFYEWNQASNTWTQKANFGGLARSNAAGFSIPGTGKGYIGTGWDGSIDKNDFWEWDQATDTWTQKADFGGSARQGAVGFSIGKKGYIGCGKNAGMGIFGYKDFWEWDQAANVWTVKAGFPGFPGLEIEAAGFSIGCYGYIGAGQGQKILDSTGAHFIVYKDFWEYTPDSQPANCCVLVAGISGPDTVCIGKNTSITASGGSNYSWSTGAVSAAITVNQSVTTTYTVTVSDANGCSDIAVITVPVKNCCLAAPAINSDPAPNTTFCVGQNVYLAASGGTSYVWNTGDTDANIAATLSVTTTYSVTVSDAAGCTGTASITFVVDPNCTTTGISQIYSNVLQMSIWPNPSSDGQFTVSGLQFPVQIQIYNVLGETVYQTTGNGKQETVNLSESLSGVYFIHVKTEQGTAAQKLVIRK